MKYMKYVCFIIFTLTVLFQLIIMISDKLSISPLERIMIIIIQILMIYGIQSDHKLHLLFCIYLLHLLDVYIFDMQRTQQLLKGYSSLNIHLFHTIHLFIKGYQRGILNIENFIINILGNFVIFMPMSYFIPCFFQKTKKWYIYLIIISVIVLVIEVLQYVLKIGSGDIDDWFLNVSGAMIMSIFLNRLDERNKE